MTGCLVLSCLSPELAVDFVAGALPAKSARSVEDHMANCQDCRKLIVGIAKLDQASLQSSELQSSERQSVVSPDADTHHAAFAPTLASPHTHLIGPTIADSEEAPTLVRGAQVGRYTLLYPLGEGGMGSVHAAFDPKLDRRVALKFLRADLLNAPKVGHQERLLREARALARLSHPHVVSIYDVAEAGGSVFLAMELIDGNNARIWRELGHRSTREIVKLYRESLNALIAAHQQGIVHRDFKPDNVMIGDDGTARVTDFGLACAAIVDVDELVAESDTENIDWDTLTQTGMAVGTPRYMAPEQFCGQANELTDQFSFCLSMYEALYGHYPLGTKTARDLSPSVPIEQQILAPLAKGDIPDSLRKALLRGMSVNPQDRWPRAQELSYELSQVFAPKSGVAKWALAGMVATSVAVAAYFLAPSPPVTIESVDNSTTVEQLVNLRERVAKLDGVDAELLRIQEKNDELKELLNEQERKWALAELRDEEIKPPVIRKIRRVPLPPPLPVQSVERSVTTRLSEVLDCYSVSIQGDNEQTIKAIVGISDKGKVKWVAPPYQGDHSASKCLERALKRLSFPDSGVATTATLTLSFYRLESGMLAVRMRAKTRNAGEGGVTTDSKGRIVLDCDPMDPLCGLSGNF